MNLSLFSTSLSNTITSNYNYSSYISYIIVRLRTISCWINKTQLHLVMYLAHIIATSAQILISTELTPTKLLYLIRYLCINLSFIIISEQLNCSYVQ